jgi:hypothetical protein
MHTEVLATRTGKVIEGYRPHLVKKILTEDVGLSIDGVCRVQLTP